MLPTAVETDAALASRATARCEIAVTVTSRIEDVENVWRELSAGEIESPGQSYDFIRQWVRHQAVPERDQRYVVGRVDGQPVALLPLHRRRVRGVSVFTWFPGSHVGCYAPVANYPRLAALGVLGRAALWRSMTGQLTGGDLVYLRAVPVETGEHIGLFEELGKTLEIETLYRARFSSWEQCDREQRSKSRRKHDRQQGDRLAALGDVEFEEVRDPTRMPAIISTMFRQRSARFRAQGIRDIFVEDGLIAFYHAVAAAESGNDVRVHVLKLNGEIVAVRYNIVHGKRMFCLISSMSEDMSIQGGSPGKQCLLRVMQTVFEDGIEVFDMGLGYTDEKRHWCNRQIPLRQHYIGLNRKGDAIVAVHRTLQRLRAWAKANNSIKSASRTLRQAANRALGRKTVSDEF